MADQMEGKVVELATKRMSGARDAAQPEPLIIRDRDALYAWQAHYGSFVVEFMREQSEQRARNGTKPAQMGAPR